LRRVRLKDSSVLALLADPLEAKLNVIEALMADFPQRRFILVGDSGERDPEVYGTIADKHPDQVLRIYIRDVTGQAAESSRYQAAFGKVPRDKWRLFQEPSTIHEGPTSWPSGDSRKASPGSG
jgi:phosphatidate phosphatase APP1